MFVCACMYVCMYVCVHVSVCVPEMDGTGGQQPRFTTIQRNYVREIGIIEKQSSMWFQGKVCTIAITSRCLTLGGYGLPLPLTWGGYL